MTQEADKKALQAAFAVPTLSNLPKKKKVEASPFTYSLCDSIDYQQESLLPKQQPPANYYSLEQVQQLLNQQKTEFMKQMIP